MPLNTIATKNMVLANTLNTNSANEVTKKLASKFSFTHINTSAELKDDCEVILLLISQYQQSEIKEWQKVCLVQGISLIPVRVAANKWQLGPLVNKSSDACLGCALTWEKNNHPNKVDYDQLNYPGAQDDFPWSNQSINHLVLILSKWIHLVNRGEEIQQVYCADTDDSHATLHQIISYSNCEICQPISDDNEHDARLSFQPVKKSSSRNYRKANPNINEKNLRNFYLDHRFGLVKHLFKSSDAHIIPMVCAEMPFVDSQGQENSYGRTDSISASTSIAILESLERYAGHAPRAHITSNRGSYNTLAKDCIEPKKFVLHDDEDGKAHLRNFKLYSDDLEFNWVWAYSFKHQKPKLIPEQLAYYRLESQSKLPVNRYVYESSNGCALGGSLEEATFYGLMEVIERDAYLTTWYGKISPTLLDVDSLDNPQIQLVLSQAKSAGYDVYLFDITLETGVPTIWAMAVNPAKNAKVKSYCAAGAHPDPEKAVMGALVEVVTSINVYEQSLPEFKDKAKAMLKDFNLTKSMTDHVLLYSLEESYEWLSFLFDSGKTADFKIQFQRWYDTEPQLNLTDELNEIIGKVLQTFDDVIVIDQTFPALKHADVNAVKVFVTGSHTVTFGNQNQRVSLSRINSARSFCDLAPLKKSQLNTTVPHNFP